MTEILIVFHILWLCLLLAVRTLAIINLNHIIMVVALIEEGEGTMLIKTEMEKGSTTILVEVSISSSLLSLNIITIQLRLLSLGGQTFKNERPICQICGKVGHIAIDCYHRMGFAYQGKNSPTKLVVMASDSNAALTNNQDP